MWIGTRGGISTFNRKEKVTSYNKLLEENGIYEKTISTIYEDAKEIMWFDLEVLIEKADKSMYEVKRKRKGLGKVR